MTGTNADVFVKFTSQLSALRASISHNTIRSIATDRSQAVNALEGRVFNGNTISVHFFDIEDFEKGKYS